MMGAVTHFLVGMLCGAAIASAAVLFRRRWLLYLPPFVLACGFWAELPILVGAQDTTHWLANVCFGYAWLHRWVPGREFAGFILVLFIMNVLLLGYVVFLTRYFGTTDMVRWEQTGPEHGDGGKRGQRSRRR